MKTLILNLWILYNNCTKKRSRKSFVARLVLSTTNLKSIVRNFKSCKRRKYFRSIRVLFRLLLYTFNLENLISSFISLQRMSMF